MHLVALSPSPACSSSRTQHTVMGTGVGKDTPAVQYVHPAALLPSPMSSSSATQHTTLRTHHWRCNICIRGHFYHHRCPVYQELRDWRNVRNTWGVPPAYQRNIYWQYTKWLLLRLHGMQSHGSHQVYEDVCLTMFSTFGPYDLDRREAAAFASSTSVLSASPIFSTCDERSKGLL